MGRLCNTYSTKWEKERTVIKQLILLVILLSPNLGRADEDTDRTDDVPTESDYRFASKYNVSRGSVWLENRARARRLDVGALKMQVAKDMEDPRGFPSARRLDDAVESAIHRGAAALREKGETAEADRIEADYAVAYRGYFVRQYANGGTPVEIGDHPPLNVWLEVVHAALHIKLGDDLCRYLHVHDLFAILDIASKYEYNKFDSKL
jgi:hypothetical protein